jgi:hypothetical protein
MASLDAAYNWRRCSLLSTVDGENPST